MDESSKESDEDDYGEKKKAEEDDAVDGDKDEKKEDADDRDKKKEDTPSVTPDDDLGKEGDTHKTGFDVSDVKHLDAAANDDAGEKGTKGLNADDTGSEKGDIRSKTDEEDESEIGEDEEDKEDEDGKEDEDDKDTGDPAGGNWKDTSDASSLKIQAKPETIIAFDTSSMNKSPTPVPVIAVPQLKMDDDSVYNDSAGGFVGLTILLLVGGAIAYIMRQRKSRAVYGAYRQPTHASSGGTFHFERSKKN